MNAAGYFQTDFEHCWYSDASANLDKCLVD